MPRDFLQYRITISIEIATLIQLLAVAAVAYVFVMAGLQMVNEKPRPAKSRIQKTSIAEPGIDASVFKLHSATNANA